jgi:hypothetical protein
LIAATTATGAALRRLAPGGAATPTVIVTGTGWLALLAFTLLTVGVEEAAKTGLAPVDPQLSWLLVVPVLAALLVVVALRPEPGAAVRFPWDLVTAIGRPSVVARPVSTAVVAGRAASMPAQAASAPRRRPEHAPHPVPPALSTLEGRLS